MCADNDGDEMTGILICEPLNFPEDAISILRECGDVYTAADQFDPTAIEVIFVRLKRMLDKSFGDEFPSLRFIVSPTTGLNHIDLKHFADKGVEIISLRGHVEFLDEIYATAEHTFAILLALLRKLPHAARHTREGGWDRYGFKGSELHGKKVLVLGYGRVGRQVAKRYEAFGCEVYAYDIEKDKVPETMRFNWPEQLQEIDILSIHVNLVDSTKNLVNADILARLTSRAIVVNTSRGEILDQAALLQRLREGRISGAALDVLHEEPQPFDAATLDLITKIGEDRLLITPHIAGFTTESLQKVEVYVAQLAVARLRSIVSEA